MAKCLRVNSAAHEPVILPQSDIVLAVAGLSALYRLGEVCFRAELAIEAWNRDVRSGDAAYPKEGKRLLKEVPISKMPLTPELLAWLLVWLVQRKTKEKIYRGVVFVVLNQADTSERREDGRKVLIS